MSIQTTRCGSMGWVSEPGGYRYAAQQPRHPAALARHAAVPAGLCGARRPEAGYPDFVPDSCMINQYLPGTKTGPAPRPRRARSARARGVAVTRPARHLFVWWPATHQQNPALPFGPWRRGGVGRPVAPGFSWRIAGGRGRPRAAGAAARQRDVSQASASPAAAAPAAAHAPRCRRCGGNWCLACR